MTFAFDPETVRLAFDEPSPAAVSLLERVPAATAEVARLLVRCPDSRAYTVFAKHATGDGLAAAERELRFYQHLAPRWASPAPRLLGRARTPDGLLLITEDLTEDGYALLPSVGPAELDQVVDTLVALHTTFWNDLQGALPFGASVTQSPQAWPPSAIPTHAAELRARAPSFGSPSDRALLNDVLASWERQFLLRVTPGRALTLGHGDFHLLGNVFFAAGRAPRVIDWSELKPALPTHDLAYCLHVPPSPDRLARDRAVLHHYWSRLVAAGITDYPWPLCEWDHQLSLITCLFQAVLQDSVTWFRKTADLVDLHSALAVLDRPPPLD